MRVRIGTLGVVVFLLTALVFAQTGQIAGIVRDASGAVLPGVTVEVASPVLVREGAHARRPMRTADISSPRCLSAPTPSRSPFPASPRSSA